MAANFGIFKISYGFHEILGKSPNFKELAQKLQELWTKAFGGRGVVPKDLSGLIRVNPILDGSSLFFNMAQKPLGLGS